MKEQIAENINKLGRFCGKRDVESLAPDCLERNYGIRQADIMVLFGGSILSGGDVMAQAMKDKVAEKYVIVGGAGHTTESLRQMVHQEYPAILAEGLSEAEIFDRYLDLAYGLRADFLETESTNCGNNITNLLALLEEKKIRFRTIILCQDASMQRRMEAGLRKYVSDQTVLINYAAYQAEVKAEGGRLMYTSGIHGMWDMDRYVRLLMGEIPRLGDDAGGYGPKGKDFIAHVDIPVEITEAFQELQKEYGKQVRVADPRYASR